MGGNYLKKSQRYGPVFFVQASFFRALPYIQACNRCCRALGASLLFALCRPSYGQIFETNGRSIIITKLMHDISHFRS